MICIKADIPKELNGIDDELKAIYHSKDTVCFYIFKTRDLRNKFVEKTKGMEKTQREEIYKQYLIWKNFNGPDTTCYIYDRSFVISTASFFKF